MRGIFETIAAGLEAKTTDISALTWSALLGAPNSRSGVSVTAITALKVTTVLGCVRVLAEGVAQLPLKLYRVAGDTKTPATDHPAYNLLYRRPNDWMTSFEMREMMMFHAVLLGNAYAYIGRGTDPVTKKRAVQELIPLVPTLVCPVQSIDYGLTYNVTDPGGGVTNVAREDIFHLRGPSWNGYLGMDAVQLAREAIGLAIATEETHASLHANGAQPGGIIAVKGTLSAAAKQRLKTAWKEMQEGVHNRFKTAVLDADATWTPMSMSGVDNQHLDTRKFQIEEICRAMRVFPQMVGHSDKTATFASAESFFLAHVVHSLTPWLVRWEQSIERDITDGEDDIIAKFSLQGLLRGDAVSRSNFYKAGILDGWMTRNEARTFEDLNPLAGLDDPMVPLNMTPRAGLGVPDAPQPGDRRPASPGPGATNAACAGGIEAKIGRVLSAANEGKIVKARDHLNDVLATVVTESGA